MAANLSAIHRSTSSLFLSW